MLQGRSAILLGSIVICLGILIGGWGCSSRQVTSGSGDQSMTKGNGAEETVLQEPIASVATQAAHTEVGEPSTGENPVSPSTPEIRSLQSRGSAAAPQASASALPPGSSAPALTVLGDIFFDFDRYAIRSDAQPILESNARWIKNESGTSSVLIEGHCDERGTLAYNLVLGEKRAKATKHYLEDLGVPASRLHTTSYGEIKPFCNEHDEGCWKYNRRAHFVVQ